MNCPLIQMLWITGRIFGAAVGSEPAGGISRPGSRLGPTPKQPPPPLPVGGGGGHSIVLCRKGDLGKTAKKASKMPLCSASAKNAKRMGKNKRKLRLSKGLTPNMYVSPFTRRLGLFIPYISSTRPLLFPPRKWRIGAAPWMRSAFRR